MKKIFALMLALLLCVSLFACGGKDQDGDASSSSSSSQSGGGSTNYGDNEIDIDSILPK